MSDRQATDKHWKHDGSCLNYYSRRAMKRRYPEGGYLLLGGIGEGLKDQTGEVRIDSECYPCYALHYAKWRYGVDGYAACDDGEGYYAVIRNHVPRHLLLLFLLLALIGALMGGMYMLGRNTALDENAVDFSPVNGESIDPDPNHIAFPAYHDMKIEAGTNVLHVALWNPKKNTCYFKFTITDVKSGNVLYASKLVAPGKAVKDVELSEVIEAGTRDISIAVDTFDLEDEDVPLNGAKVDVKLTGVKRSG